MKSGTNVNNSSRRQKNKSLDLVDGISALPDAILGLILSFLPTKEAVATAFLSKRWKFLWRIVHNLDFCHQDRIKSLRSENENMKFVQFVDRVLLLHDVGLLYKFRLEWNHDQISSSHVNSWISNAITRNVHEISLFTELYVRPFEIPVSVFSCDSLRSLELYEIYVPAVDVICLPRLEILELVCTGFQSEEEFEKLISKCPMLNFLHLEADVVYMEDLGISAEFAYIISSTSVKRLELSFVSESAVDDTDNSLMLKASSLEYLKLEGFIARISVPKTLSSLVEADIRIELPLDEPTSEEFCNSIVEAVDAFCWVKALTLSADATWALSFGTISLRSMFKRLVKLEATIYCCYHRALQDLIENSYNLEVLTVHQRASYDGTMTSNHDDHTPWTAPEIAQICLSNSLKKVVMDSYYDYENVREMIRYMLKHGSVLEEMHIYCSRQRPDTEKLAFVHEICKFPRKSPFCEVEISYTG